MPTPTPRRLAILAAATSLGLAAACSSNSTTTTAATTTAAPAAAPATTAKVGTNIDVTMTEWELKPSATSAPAGTITFTNKNVGSEVHELAMFKTDLDPAALPLDDEGAVDERGQGVELIDEVEDVKPGETKAFTVEGVKPGKYLLVCNLVEKGDSHFGHKMYVPFTVT